jgi:mono/diheme cytochrome c family protein
MQNLCRFALACIFLLTVFLQAPPANAAALALATSRQNNTDLEISGNIRGLRANAVGYISYLQLLHLPLITFTVPTGGDYEANENFSVGFTKPITVTGIDFEVLARALGADVTQDMLVAQCSDGYRASYPTEYIAAHHPVLVLTINGLPPQQWPHSHYGDVMAPYLVAYADYRPSFRILSHSDQPQVPYAVTRIEFRDQRSTFAAITPPGTYPADSPILQGFAIAKQNCFRCHNNGTAGGTMAHHPWQVLAAWAAYQPDYFTRYVKNPNAFRSDARMPGNPQYDPATLEALRRYFATFAAKK